MNSPVTLISGDGFKFVLEKDVALESGTLSKMLTGEFEEATRGKVELGSIDGAVLEKVVEYLHYHAKYKDIIDAPEFDVPTEMALELLVAADYLDV